MTAESIPANAPWCMPADPDTRRPRIVLPPHSCDTHAHVCGPFAKYPYATERLYTPPDETWPMYRRMLDTLGVGRAVLTQPSGYNQTLGARHNPSSGAGIRQSCRT